MKLREAYSFAILLFLATLLEVPLFEVNFEVIDYLRELVTVVTFFLANVIDYCDCGSFVAK